LPSTIRSSTMDYEWVRRRRIFMIDSNWTQLHRSNFCAGGDSVLSCHEASSVATNITSIIAISCDRVVDTLFEVRGQCQVLQVLVFGEQVDMSILPKISVSKYLNAGWKIYSP